MTNPAQRAESVKIEASGKGNRAFADLRYGEEDIISPSTLICAAIKS